MVFIKDLYNLPNKREMCYKLNVCTKMQLGQVLSILITFCVSLINPTSLFSWLAMLSAEGIP